MRALQLSLEIGDECYVFEQYGLSVPGHAHDNSKQRPPSWYRGYVVCASACPCLSLASPPEADFGSSKLA